MARQQISLENTPPFTAIGGILTDLKPPGGTWIGGILTDTRPPADEDDARYLRLLQISLDDS